MQNLTIASDADKKKSYLDLYKELLKTLEYFYKLKDYNIGQNLFNKNNSTN